MTKFTKRTEKISKVTFVLGATTAAMLFTSLACAQDLAIQAGNSTHATQEFLVRPVQSNWGHFRQAIDDEVFSATALSALKESAETLIDPLNNQKTPTLRRPLKVFPAAANPKEISDHLRQAADQFAAKAPMIELRQHFYRLYVEGERNAVLNFQRVALASMSTGKWELAEKALDQALLRIDTIYANNEQAEKARSVFTQEQAKDFKGEPYERAMAYYYRGLLYTARADYQNARAMFMQAEYQDTVSEIEKFAGDFGVMPLLAAWVSACDGNSQLAQEFRERAIKADASLGSVDLGRRNLVIFEAGRAPFKFNVGQHGQGLSWMRHRAAAESPPQPVCLSSPASDDLLPSVAKESPSASGSVRKKSSLTQDVPLEALGSVCSGTFLKAGDLGFQATTRGGRAVDLILQGKAAFKENAQGVADAAQQVSTLALLTSAQTGNRDMAGLGLAGLLVGMAAQTASSNTKAQADVREWEQLPLELWLAQMPKNVQARSLTRGSLSLVQMGAGGTCQIFWGRENSGTKRFYEAGPIEPSEESRDEAFRRELTTQL